MKYVCYHIAQVLAHVLANKPFIFFQTIIIKIYLLYTLCENIIIFNLCRIENNRINSVFFSSSRERLDVVTSASINVLAHLKNNILETTHEKKVPYEIEVIL